MVTVRIRIRIRTNMPRILNTESYVPVCQNSEVSSFFPDKIGTGLHSLNSDPCPIIVLSRGIAIRKTAVKPGEWILLHTGTFLPVHSTDSPLHWLSTAGKKILQIFSWTAICLAVRFLFPSYCALGPLFKSFSISFRYAAIKGYLNCTAYGI